MPRKLNKPGGRERYASTTSMVNNKGLLNEPGQNNCFLNSAIQVLWHLDVFRRSFRLLHGHACMGPTCIFCALKNIFDQFEYSSDHALPPTVLRSALAETFQQQNRFQLGLMDDAAECFENILLRIHVHIGNTVREDVCTAAHCIPHQKFGLSLIEQCVCSSCGATSEPLPFIEMVHYVSATALCTEDDAMRHRYGSSMNYSQMFGRLIKIAGSWGDVRKCPSDCGAEIEMRKVLMNCPDVVSLGIVWDSDVPLVKNIEDLLHALGTTLKLVDLFHTVVDERAMNAELYLVGMVCYYGKHYSTFFFHTKLRKWVYFDDAQVSEVGKRWGNVITKCIKGHHQPLLLLYANPNSTPICTNTAPKNVTILPGYSGEPGYNKFVQEDVIQHNEYDSVASDGESHGYADEESSGTESMQASNLVTRLPTNSKPVKQTKLKSAKPPNSKIKEMVSSIQNQYDKPINHKKKTEHHIPKNTTPDTYNPRDKEKESLTKIIGRKTVAEVQSKPKFQWNVTNNQTRSHHNERVGQYVEPNPAQWTKYQPYSQPKNKQKIVQPSLESNEQESKQQINNFIEQNDKKASVKDLDNADTAKFCTPSKTSGRSSSPSLSLRSSLSQATVNSIESKIKERSSVSKISDTETSSQTSHASQRGRKSSFVAQSSRVSDATTPIMSSSNVERLSQSPDQFSESSIDKSVSQTTKEENLKGEILHEPQFFQNKTFTKVISEKPTKPPLPPKPPFLSRPTFPKSLTPDNPTSNVLRAHCNISNNLFPIRLYFSEQQPNNLIPNYLQSFSLTAMSSFQLLTQQSENDLDKKLCSCDKLALKVKCAALLQDTDRLMIESKSADTAMDYSSALQLCLEATKVVESILMMEGVTEEHLVQARLKHGDCINKSRILQRRKSIRRQSLEKGSGKYRSSMTEADRHIASDRSPISPSNNNELVEHSENDNLINFDKSGISSLQHGIDQMYEEQKEIRLHPNYREPIGLISSNTNNSNNLKLNSESSVSAKQEPSSSRTNIFVWNSPVNDKKGKKLPNSQQLASSASGQIHHTILSSTSANSSMANPMKSLTGDEKDKDVNSEIIECTKSLDIDPNNKFRSKTPTPQTYSQPLCISQQRRSKTPTPALKNKTMLRSHVSRQSDAQRTRPLSYNITSTKINNDLNSVPSHRKQAQTSENNFSSSGSMDAPSNYMYPMVPYQFPHWGNMGQNYPMPYPPQQFYSLFNETMMKKFYESLTPEQKQQAAQMYSMNSNIRAIGPTRQQMHKPFANQTSLQEPYTEASKSHLDKNLPNLTSNLKKVVPGIVNNIYEANKPRPVPKNVYGDTLSRNSQRTKSPTTNGPSKLSINSANIHQKQSNEKNVKPPKQTMNGAQISNKFNQPTVNQSTNSTVQGMMKFPEGKSRESNSRINSEYKAKLLHDFANRPNKNYTTIKKSVPNYPKENQKKTLNNNGSNQQHNQIINSTKCNLCGLVAVDSQGEYCSTCRAYLTRFKPTINSQR